MRRFGLFHKLLVFHKQTFLCFSSHALTRSLLVRLQGAGHTESGILHGLSQLLLLFALLLGRVLLLHLTVLQLVLQLHAARFQQAAESRPTLLGARLRVGGAGGRERQRPDETSALDHIDFLQPFRIFFNAGIY